MPCRVVMFLIVASPVVRKTRRDAMRSPLPVPQQLLDLVQQRHLRGVDLLPRRRQVEELGAVNFRELHLLPRLRGSLHLERVAPNGRGVEVAFHRPRVDRLPTLLLHGGERDKATGGSDS